MPDADARRPTAEALARWRVSVGFAVGVIVIVVARPSARSIAIGMSVAALGEALRIWAAGHLRKGREVTASGPYRWIGHPLYLGSSVMGVGLAIACASVSASALIAVYLAAAFTAAIRSEEASLRGKFGEQYEEYRRGASVDRRFSLRQAVANREYRAVVGLAVGLLLLILKATYNGSF